MKITIPTTLIDGIRLPYVEVELTDDWVTWDGRSIGRVRKGTRTYSPPVSRGSRIVKYHKQVPCWYASIGDRYFDAMTYDTRRAAIAALIAKALEP